MDVNIRAFRFRELKRPELYCDFAITSMHRRPKSTEDSIIRQASALGGTALQSLQLEGSCDSAILGFAKTNPELTVQ
jgi:hypothetical protein